ncbi:chemosensory receptor c [Plakobranchus ocellatus]|uniref:Chemosensory receptor c n=1 Tax=Plakobranchus ocellatus TaxID=259542 RepID=A0AAV4CG75_9GAST|nr:chemosensory receptor c [Plakobranchus ocellatus]
MNYSLMLDNGAVRDGRIISNDIALYLTVILTLLMGVFSVPSIVINIINIFIFTSTGVKDSITVCFLALAVADLSAMVLATAAALCAFFDAIRVTWSSSLKVYGFSIGAVYSLLSDISAAITTYIALQRGICVALPFAARRVFTRISSLRIITTTVIFLLVCSLPRLLSFRLVTLNHPAMNVSKVLVIKFLNTWTFTDTFYLLFVKTGLACLEHIVMVVCVVAIFVGMRSSRRLKHSASAWSKPEEHRNATGQPGFPSDAGRRREGNGNQSKPRRKEEGKGKQLDTKEDVVIKQSLLIVLIHIVCTTPRVLVCLYRFFEPRFQIGELYEDMFYVVYMAINVLDSINAFLNFFVYIRLNSRFKVLFMSAFSKKA